ncbi:DUF1702 family protein [Streptomyces sp. TRM43335]|uniref:DUF1702 family protein n=1 Tax=Streptomyces taklimakanensis TaxID=2569853 RepID=A0A6G2BJN1_9ACTN|nr:DUF1702 family protein [Streptomyces taklimakanensis]MTE22487.1 DUF1702 family protein [Streptomyces taklimakanensis]
MSTIFGALRRRILTPSVSETKLEKRGFHRKNRRAQEQLETIGRVFLEGYGHAVRARSAAEAEESLEAVPRAYRGFAYEGAGMGAVVHDALPGHSGRLEGLLAGKGRDHVYMVHVGIGWAMARLPRFLWPDVERTDPLLRWLILDGYGFHQAYFHTRSYVRTPHVRHPFSWAGGPDDHSAKVIDQGIGRALWFVGGTDVDVVTDLIASYPEHRRGDLYAGAGLAATYAGAADEEELRRFAERAGKYRFQLAQGAAFAAEARDRAGTTIAHTHLATRVLCGTTPERAARVCLDRMPAPGDHGDVPAYERWRRDIAAELASTTLSRKGADL